jgi:catechol 2,3-dioxygenase-like lactoylglutathione lyase family enzyme
MSTERAVPILPVDDLEIARRFYVDALGFESAFEASDDGRTGLLGVRRGSIELTLDCPMPGHGRNACVSLRVDNADRYYEEWRGRAAVLRPPRDETWGARTFDLADPFGNTIFVIGPAGGSPGPRESAGRLTSGAALAHPRYVLAVPDLARSGAYYRDVLGFRVFEIGDPGWRWLERDGCVILAGECPDAIPPGSLGDHSYFAYVTVEGIDALHAEFVSHGVELTKPLRDEPWKMREFGIRTVDGHRMMFGAPLTAPQPHAATEGEDRATPTGTGRCDHAASRFVGGSPGAGHRHSPPRVDTQQEART